MNDELVLIGLGHISLAISIIGWILAFISFNSSRYCSIRRAKKLVKTNLLPFLKSRHFDLILTPSIHGSLICQMAIDCTEQLDLKSPLNNYITLPYLPVNKVLNFNDANNPLVIQSSKFYITIPEHILTKNTVKVLIIDDVSKTGESLEKIVRFFNKNYPNMNVVTYALVSDGNARQKQFIPDYYAYLLQVNKKYHFGWRKNGRIR